MTGVQTCALPIYVIEHAERIERLAHRVLALHGKHLRGEWFEATIKDAVVAIEIATRQAEGEELNLGGCLRIVAETKDKQTSLRLSEATLSSLDQLRRDEADLPTRAEMIRRLIERAVTKRPTRSKSET